MTIENLLSEYELVEDNMYLRSDKKAVAAVSPDGNSIGFLKILPESKKYFEGEGIVLKENIGAIAINTSFFTQLDITGYTRSGSDKKMLTITEEQIKEFLGNTSKDTKEVHDYLNDFSKVACEAYAIDTAGNKIRNFIATQMLKYSPSMAKQRKHLRQQIKGQIPGLVDKLSQMLDTLQQQVDSLPAEEIEGYEELVGQPLNELFDKTREELQSLLEEKVMKKVKFTGTKNKAEYKIHNCFKSWTGKGVMEVYRFDRTVMLNCKSKDE